MEEGCTFEVGTGKELYISKGKEDGNAVKIGIPTTHSNKENSVIILHNHPNKTMFSRTDIKECLHPNRTCIKASVVITPDGKVYKISDFDGTKNIEELFNVL